MDPRTGFVIATLMMLLNGGVLGLMHKGLSPDVQPSAADGRIGTLLFAGGSIFFAVQDMFPAAFILPVANGFMFVGLVLYARAVRRFAGLPDTPWLFALSALGVFLVYWFVAVHPDFGTRAILASMIWLITIFLAVRAMYQGGQVAQHLGDLRSRSVLAAVFILVGLFILFRAATYMVRPSANNTLLNAADVFNVLAPLGSSALPVIGTTAFLVLCSVRIRRQWERTAAVDFLTNLPNRRTIIGTGEARLSEARRRKAPFAVAIIDIDHFKSVNDTHGHDIGDLALRHIAGLLAQHCRGPRMAGRFGGEEFVALLEVDDVEQAHAAAERLRRVIEQSPLDAKGNTLKLTASIGIGVLAAEDRHLDDLLHRADQALYAAKAGGRNRVEMANAPAAENAAPVIYSS